MGQKSQNLGTILLNILFSRMVEMENVSNESCFLVSIFILENRFQEDQIPKFFVSKIDSELWICPVFDDSDSWNTQDIRTSFKYVHLSMKISQNCSWFVAKSLKNGVTHYWGIFIPIGDFRKNYWILPDSLWNLTTFSTQTSILV